MNRARTSSFTSSLQSGLLVLLVGGALSSCRAEEEADSSSNAQQAEAEPGCLEFRGNRHCALGGAALTSNGEALIADGLKSAEKDGVAILLPDVKAFIPTGKFQEQGGPSTMVARSINEGVSTSTMTTSTSAEGMTLSASFTGNGDESKYSAIFYSEGKETGRIANLPNGGSVSLMWPRFPCEPWPWCIIEPLLPPVFRVLADAPHLGACEWGFRTGTPMEATLSSGEHIKVDFVELREEVSPDKSSYPYLTFNRIDYLSDGGSLTLTDERIE